MKRYLPIIIFFAAAFGVLLFLTYYEPPRRDVLDETIWEVVNLNDTAPVEGTTLTIRFHDGVVKGSSGCNTYNGSYEVNRESISIGKLDLTTDNCMKPGIMDQERAFAAYLEDATSFSLSGVDLTISMHTGGQVILKSMLEK